MRTQFTSRLIATTSLLAVSWASSACSNTSGSYDFIVVGAGIAGLVQANRLTEDPNINVLLIEAGILDSRPPGILVPGDWDPDPYFWPDIITQPLTELNNRTSLIPIGKLVGGGSSLNAMNWLRGAISDYNGLEETFANPGWGWNDVLPFFMKSENFEAPSQEYAQTANISWDPSVRGTNGPVDYSYPDYYYPSEANFWNAALSVGYKAITDPNNGGPPGLSVSPTVLNTTSYTRCDARAAYYDPVYAQRPNLQLLTSTQVARVTFNGTHATGIEVQPSEGGALCALKASREVILAAGAIHTPQILQLSGIGPKALLQSLGIPIIANLPGVGTNLQDHIALPVYYNYSHDILPNSMSLMNNATYNAVELSTYHQNQSSAYTIVSGLSNNWLSTSLQSTPNASAIISAARAYNASLSLPPGTDATVLAGYKAQRKMLLDQMSNPNVPTGNLFWFTGNYSELANTKPLSRGRVQIATTNISDPPVIEYNTATDPSDFQVIISFLRKNRELFAAPGLAELGATEVAPFGDDVQTDEEIIKVMREVLAPTAGHVCCTAPMMPLSMGGVVDSRRNVYGVSGLRVADISAFPLEVSTGPTPTVYGLAERLADFIKSEWGIAEYRRRR